MDASDLAERGTVDGKTEDRTFVLHDPGIDGTWMLQALPASHNACSRHKVPLLPTPAEYRGAYALRLSPLGTI